MRNPKDKEEVINNCLFIYTEENNFENQLPIHLEIGMGKGDFIIGMAKAYPNINFIGIEKYSSVACTAIKKITEQNLENVKILIIDVVDSTELLKNKIDKIYLNFSDPWPKDRHAKRRLTHENQLKVYDSLFKGNPEIEMKTDNIDLFNYSVQSFKDYGYQIINISNDLHNLDKFNIKTEYENKFSAKGYKINFVHIKK